MDLKQAGVGTRVIHPSFGEGVMVEDLDDTCVLYFKSRGEVEMSKDYDDLEDH